MSMADYTKWAIKYPWHVSGEKEYQYPADEKGNCACTCEFCNKMWEHKANKEAHMH